MTATPSNGAQGSTERVLLCHSERFAFLRAQHSLLGEEPFPEREGRYDYRGPSVEDHLPNDTPSVFHAGLWLPGKSGRIAAVALGRGRASLRTRRLKASASAGRIRNAIPFDRLSESPDSSSSLAGEGGAA